MLNNMYHGIETCSRGRKFYLPPVIHAVWMVNTNRIKGSGVRGGLKINFHPYPPTAPSHTDTALALGIIIGYGTASVSKMPPLDLSPALPRALF